MKLQVGKTYNTPLGMKIKIIEENFKTPRQEWALEQMKFTGQMLSGECGLDVGGFYYWSDDGCFWETPEYKRLEYSLYMSPIQILEQFIEESTNDVKIRTNDNGTEIFSPKKRRKSRNLGRNR